MKVLLPLCFIFFLACKSERKYPDGGYPYPKEVADKDTNFYYYPYRNALSRKDSFNYGTEYVFYRNFSESNLSLHPMTKEVFRLTYSGWGVKTYIILLTENAISIKSGRPGELYDWNENALSPVEKTQISVLRRYFPLDGFQKRAFIKLYLDSMIKADPRLLNPQYYLDLEKKENPRNSHAPFDSTVNIPISTETFNNLVGLINASGFWSLPFLIKCDDYGPDGSGGFTLEANTKTKYKVVHVCGGSPGDTTKFAQACQKLIEFAHLEKKIRCFAKKNTQDSVIVKDVQLEEIKQELPRKPSRHKKH